MQEQYKHIQNICVIESCLSNVTMLTKTNLRWLIQTDIF